MLLLFRYVDVGLGTRALVAVQNVCISVRGGEGEKDNGVEDGGIKWGKTRKLRVLSEGSSI